MLWNWFGRSDRETSAALALISASVPLAGLLVSRGFVAAGPAGLTYRFPFRPTRSLSWDQIRINEKTLRISRVRGGISFPLRLPTVGLPRKRRRAIHVEIREKWRVATRDR